ncbi:hypothetical protein GOP47_0018777 [Adiantum capillus-veneris]|uniref:NADP-dependent oxidoreductase domain-containing protein n=1 Tax=Adiantum capillus-veneris TaxID=13818 RepID=A0A9D4UES2_ADICA|nr:hypothetical protein GOP47_0018777 [Adiantum capillus-veneris]
MPTLCASTPFVATARFVPPQTSKFVPLGRTSLQVSKIGIGTLQWGDPSSGFGSSFGEAELCGAFQQLLKGGINFIDTAEVYGYQGIKSGTSAEQLVGKFSKQRSENASDTETLPIIATKFFTIPWSNFLVGGGFRLGRKSLLEALRRSLQRLGRKRVDLYQIHFPFPTLSNAALMESLKESVELDLTSAVGVSNYSKQQMEEADDLLAKFGVPLASNQVRFNLLHRNPDKEGLLTACKERNISLIAYSPLASGSLTDKALMTESTKSGKSKPLLELMEKIGTNHNGKSISQVALSYLIMKGAIPIPGCKNEFQARSHCELLDWSITMDEVKMLEEAAENI